MHKLIHSYTAIKKIANVIARTDSGCHAEASIALWHIRQILYKHVPWVWRLKGVIPSPNKTENQNGD